MRDLVKRYGDHLAVNHLSFTVEKGQVYGFLGPNGAGKSTTMNIMTGYIGPTEGEVLINGHSILDEPEAAKRYIGYLPEVPPLYSDMTVLEYLGFAAELKRIPKIDRRAEVERVIAATHIEDMLFRLTSNLSKGYRQRVGVAQAILGSPEIIILDEPTIGLDPTQILEMRELIRNLSKEHTIILSSHILAEVQAVCNYLMIINRGVLVASGTPSELEAQMNSSSVDVTVRSDSLEAVEKALSSVQNVENVKLWCGSDGEVSAELTIKRGFDVREPVFNACVENALPLLRLNAGEASLERVFLELLKEGESR